MDSGVHPHTNSVPNANAFSISVSNLHHPDTNSKSHTDADANYYTGSDANYNPVSHFHSRTNGGTDCDSTIYSKSNTNSNANPRPGKDDLYILERFWIYSIGQPKFFGCWMGT